MYDIEGLKDYGVVEKEIIFFFEVILDFDLNKLIVNDNREIWILIGYLMVGSYYFFRWGNNIVVIFKRKSIYFLEIFIEVYMDDVM